MPDSTSTVSEVTELSTVWTRNVGRAPLKAFICLAEHIVRNWANDMDSAHCICVHHLTRRNP